MLVTVNGDFNIFGIGSCTTIVMTLHLVCFKMFSMMQGLVSADVTQIRSVLAVVSPFEQHRHSTDRTANIYIYICIYMYNI